MVCEDAQYNLHFNAEAAPAPEQSDSKISPIGRFNLGLGTFRIAFLKHEHYQVVLIFVLTVHVKTKLK